MLSKSEIIRDILALIPSQNQGINYHGEHVVRLKNMDHSPTYATLERLDETALQHLALSVC